VNGYQLRFTGDALTVLSTLPAAYVHTCVTSPAYYRLRDFGVDGQLGLESTPQEYIARQVAVFRELRRVLRPDGTLWLNLGDAYAGSATIGNKVQGNPQFNAGRPSRAATKLPPKSIPLGWKAKDLLGMPWGVADALRADGWYLRSDIIWAKPNPMPESVRDRPTKSHEYVFLLAPSERYYYDADAIREPHETKGELATEENKRGSWRVGAGSGGGMVENAREARAAGRFPTLNHPAGKNRRTVWTIPPRPCDGAHFAVFPPDLVRPCILAGTSEKGCCPGCGACWVRVREKDTVGWRPACRCGGGPVPCTVIDPFMGSGTVGVVAKELGRSFVGIELNPAYVELARRRIDGTA
jgi:DNA modification methylase